MENELNEMFIDWYPETPVPYDTDNINKQKVIFWTVFAMAATVAYEVALFNGIEYIVNRYKNKKSQISINQPIKKPTNTLSFYQATGEKVKE